MIRSLAALALLLAAPAAARVVTATDTIAIVQVEALVKAPPERVWATLVAPSRWWPAKQAWSGDAANLQLGERAGGCLCETLPGGGAVEHMRVVRIEPRRLLRLTGALGPMQAQPVAGPLTIELIPAAGGTRVTIVHALSGSSAPPLSAMAPLVDTLLGEQIARLKAAAERPAPIEPARAAASPAAPPPTTAATKTPAVAPRKPAEPTRAPVAPPRKPAAPAPR